MRENITNSQIPRTKLHRPPVPSDFVQRQKLNKYLNQNLNQPLTIISAPAGYGKSTLISSWLESCEYPSAWVSLDEGDDDPKMFLSYFIAAVQNIYPEFGKNTQALINAVELPPLSVLRLSLTNELELLDDYFILVLDDYHKIHDPNIHKFLSELLRHPSKSIHLAICSRRDPPLPLATLRARDQMREVRTTELCFSVEETKSLLGNILGSEIDTNTATILLEKTEGWVAALRLVAISKRHKGNLSKFIDNLRSSSIYTMDYLMEEILTQLEPEIKDFLIKTSILHKLSGPLCDYVAKLDEPVCNGQAYLEWFQKVNLFTIPLDEQKYWFRYHHLFKELLERELKKTFGKEIIDDLNKRAGQWLGNNGFAKESITHFLKATDIGSAIGVFKANRRELMNRVEWQQLEHLLKLFPDEKIKKDAELLLSKSWALIYQGKAFEAFELLPSISLLLERVSTHESNAKNLYGELQVIKAWESYNIQHDFNATFHQSKSALKNLYSNNFYPRGIALIFWVGALQALGKYDDAIKVIYEKIGVTSNHILKSSLLLSLNYIYWLEADLSNLKRSAEQMDKIGQTEMNLEASVNSYYFSGIAYYHQNKLHRAIEMLEKAFENRFHTIGIHNIHISCALALAYQGSGKTEKVAAVVNKISEFATSKGNPYFNEIRRALEAEINWRRGNEAEAIRWADQVQNLPLVPFTNFFIIRITLLKILIKEGSEKSWNRASTLLDELEIYLKRCNNRRFLIEIYALKALLLYQTGNKDQAITTLQNSLQIAESVGIIRPYLDMGSQMFSLLKVSVKNNIMVGFAGKLLTAFREEGALQTIRPTQIEIGEFTETISKRELEILTHLGQRMSNKEIAEKLFISPETVKRHTITIYNKLNVHSRQEAVERAAALGLL